MPTASPTSAAAAPARPGARTFAALDLDRLDAQAAELLAALIRVPSVNPPGHERAAAHLLRDWLAPAGLAARLYEGAPGRTNLAVRYPGTGAQAPLLLSGHLDVVPVEREHWRHEPFGAEVHDGCLWGRGAIDMKNMVAMEAAVLRALAESGARPRRDVLLLAVADEEAGCEWGSKWMAAHAPDTCAAEYALNEGGGFTLHADGRRFYPVQVAEKGICWLQMRARGAPGHGSIPQRDAALVRLARAVALLGTHSLPFHATEAAVAFVRGVAGAVGGLRGRLLSGLAHPTLHRFVRETLIPGEGRKRAFQALFENTANPTMLHAGVKVNVVPGEALLEVDGRLLPGQTTASFLAELRALLADDTLEITVAREHGATASDRHDPILRRIEAVIDHHDPGARVVPVLSTGFTDSAFYRPRGVKCYGFAPLRLGPELDFQALFHGHNERIPLAGFHWGLRCLLELVADLCGVP